MHYFTFIFSSVASSKYISSSLFKCIIFHKNITYKNHCTCYSLSIMYTSTFHLTKTHYSHKHLMHHFTFIFTFIFSSVASSKYISSSLFKCIIFHKNITYKNHCTCYSLSIMYTSTFHLTKTHYSHKHLMHHFTFIFSSVAFTPFSPILNAVLFCILFIYHVLKMSCSFTTMNIGKFF